jgi:hypothetical protein
LSEFQWAAATASIAGYYVRCARTLIGEKAPPVTDTSIDTAENASGWSKTVGKAVKDGEGSFKPAALGGKSVAQFVSVIAPSYAKDCPKSDVPANLTGSTKR